MRFRGRAAEALAATIALLATPAAADVTPSPSPTLPPPPVTVELASLAPLAPQPGNTLTLRGTLHNTSSGPVTNLTVQLLLSTTPIGSRSEFDGYADTPPQTPFAPDTTPVPSQHATLPRSSLPVDATEPFTVSVPVDALALPKAWQVYRLGVAVTGLTSAGTQTVGRLRTFLPWAPLGVPGVGLPTQVAWLWPVVDRPHRASASAWLDDALARELSGGGRLARLVTAGAAAQTQHAPPPAKPPRRRRHQPARPAPPTLPVNPVPVTWAIDPMLVEDVADMAGGYRVAGPDGAHDGTGTRAASAWLTALRAAASHGSVLALPYADPDVVAAVRGGLASEVQVALRTGQTMLAHALDAEPLTFAWPPGGFMDQRTLDTLFAGNVNTVVLDSGALPVVGGALNETPGTRTTVSARDGNVEALLSDHVLSSVVTAGAADPTQGALDVQRVLSELLMIQAELPSDQRTIVIAPDRRWAPSGAYAKALLADSGRVPWVAPVSLSAAALSPPYTKVRRGPLTFPGTARAAELPRRFVRAVRALKARLDTFAAIVLPDGIAETRRFDDALLRSLSSAWRTDPTGGVVERDSVARTLADTMQRVRITSRAGSLVTLTSHSGRVPVTVSNDLDVPVRVRVVLRAGLHLRVSASGTVVRTIPAHRQFPIDVRATARTSGVFPLTVALSTPDGRPYGEPVQLFVRSTVYGIEALLITGGATAILLVAVAVRLARRARAARRTARAARSAG